MSVITENLRKIFAEAAFVANTKGYSHMVIFPRSEVFLSADDKIRVSAIAAENSKRELDVNDISSDFISGRIGCSITQRNGSHSEGKDDRISFVAFKHASEQQAMIASVNGFEFFNDEKVFVEAYDARKSVEENNAHLVATSSFFYGL